MNEVSLEGCWVISEVAVEGSSEDAALVSWESWWVISEVSLKGCGEDDGAVVSL